jgi:predicted nucleotide-binding protein (sugar kinase/HSP70/actin superfamily)
MDTSAAGTETRVAHGALPARDKLRLGIPRVLNVWSTHQFWIGLFGALGLDARRIVFSSDTSDEQMREFGKGRGTVDSCYPVKCVSAHYGELLALDRHRRIDVLFSPMIYSVPSFLHGHVVDSLPGVTRREVEAAVRAGYAALEAFAAAARRQSREILEDCARLERPCLLVLARPYHMDPGIGHEIEVDLQAYGFPVLWGQYLPTDPDLLAWMFGAEVAAGQVRSGLDIADVWPSSYSANTNEILWAAKFAARMPWIAGVIRLSSYECGMDQPTYTPVQQIVERSGTLFFSFQDLDSTKPAGAVRIRVETIAHYLARDAAGIIARKRDASPPDCPLGGTPAPAPQP